jgi:hypothetical protein
MSVLAEHIQKLRQRLAKEIARGESGTAALGGLTAAGNALEKVLKEAARAVCHAAGTSLDRELAARAVPASIGAFGKILSDKKHVVVHDSTDAQIIRMLVADCGSGRASAIRAMQHKVRNQAVHADGDPFRDSGEILKRLMRLVERVELGRPPPI